MKDFWIAKLSDGSTVEEDWIVRQLSPWTRLMNYCKENRICVIMLRLVMGEETYDILANAEGYWQSHAMPSIQGVDCDEELHKWRGIGFVANGLVHIIWAARDPQTHQLCAWTEERSAHDQNQIIWQVKEKLLVPVLAQDNNDINSRIYSNKILGAS